MKDPFTEQTRSSRRGYGPCGSWGSMHRNMWMWGPMMAARFAGFGSGRAQRWMYDNPSDSEVIEFLEEYQRDLEQQIEDVRTRIEEIRSRRAE